MENSAFRGEQCGAVKDRPHDASGRYFGTIVKEKAWIASQTFAKSCKTLPNPLSLCLGAFAHLREIEARILSSWTT